MIELEMKRRNIAAVICEILKVIPDTERGIIISLTPFNISNAVYLLKIN